MVESSGDILKDQEIYKEIKIVEEFFNMLGKEKDKTAYGIDEVKKALGFGAVDKLLLSKNLKKSEIRFFQKTALETGVKVELISIDTEEGRQFWNLGGVGGILRYKI